MKRAPAEIIAAAKAAYRPSAPSQLELVPGDHDAIAKLAKQEAWLATLRRWLNEDREAKRAFNAFVAREKQKSEDGAA